MKLIHGLLLTGVTASLLTVASIEGLAFARPAAGEPDPAPIEVGLLAQGRERGEAKEDGAEEQEPQRLEALASISPARAKQLAMKAQKGTVQSVRLEVEGDSLFYEVVIDRRELLIDAGNGQLISNRLISAKDPVVQPRGSIMMQASEASDEAGESEPSE